MFVIIFGVCSFYIDGWIDTDSIGIIFAVGFIVETICALQDIAVDGWMLTLFDKEHQNWAGAMQLIGANVG